MTNQYERALEHSPDLLTRLSEAASEPLDLKAEANLARGMLSEVLSILGKAHGQTGLLDAGGLDMVLMQLRQVTDIIDRAATIESKKTDQRIEVSKLVVLLASLRDDMRRNLMRAGLDPALEYVDAAFARAKWTGDMSEEDVDQILAAPVGYDVAFRPIERVDGKPREISNVGSKPEDVLRSPTEQQIEEIKQELVELKSGDSSLPRPSAIGSVPSPLKRGAKVELTKTDESAYTDEVEVKSKISKEPSNLVEYDELFGDGETDIEEQDESNGTTSEEAED